VISPSLPKELEGRQISHKKNLLQSLSQLWVQRAFPEVRDTRRYAERKNYRPEKDAKETRVFLQDIPAILDLHQSAELKEGDLFGELAALGRVPRSSTVFANGDTVLLEIRWQGLRELRKFDPGWRRMIDDRYRERGLKAHLAETPLLAGLDALTLEKIANATLFETFGTFDWNISYQKLRRSGEDLAAHEPVMARQGDYSDGLLMIRAGFARVSVKFGNSERTLTYLSKGEYFGIDEQYVSWRDKKRYPLETSLLALGYVDILRVPTCILEEYVFPKIQPPSHPLIDLAKRPVAEDTLLEWAVAERFSNATQAMVIDLDKCTRCDDCVRACASTHEGNPRFIRHGKTVDHWMVANACMHCVDPVCMIGCPTGAIHRIAEGGSVVINDNTCIGCGVCANSCPYDNIRMVKIRDLSGNPVLDPKTQNSIMKATKCDFCTDQLGGPACQRACPHDALRRTDFLALLSRSQ